LERQLLAASPLFRFSSLSLCSQLVLSCSCSTLLPPLNPPPLFLFERERGEALSSSLSLSLEREREREEDERGGGGRRRRRIT
jgi:hypothetical protein